MGESLFTTTALKRSQETEYMEFVQWLWWWAFTHLNKLLMPTILGMISFFLGMVLGCRFESSECTILGEAVAESRKEAAGAMVAGAFRQTKAQQLVSWKGAWGLEDPWGSHFFPH